MSELDRYSSLTCPITLSIMKDPVILSGDGHTYERSAIERWLEKHSTSPITNVKLPPTSHLIPNHALRNAIEQVSSKHSNSSSSNYPQKQVGTPTLVLGMEEKDDAKPSLTREGSSWSMTSDDSPSDNSTSIFSPSSFRIPTYSNIPHPSAPVFPTQFSFLQDSAGFSKVGNSLLNGSNSTSQNQTTWQKMEIEEDRRRNASMAGHQTSATASSSLTASSSSTDSTSKGIIAKLRNKTTDHIIISGSPLKHTSTMSVSGLFQTYDPCTSNEGAAPESSHSTKMRILSSSGAKLFPGLLATGGADNCVSLWVHTREDVVKEVEEKHWYSSIMPTRTKEKKNLSGSEDEEGKQGRWSIITVLKGPRDWINTVNLSSDGTLLLSGSRSGSVNLWRSPQMGPAAGEWKAVSEKESKSEGGGTNSAAITCSALHSSNSYFVTGGGDWAVRLWDIETETEYNKGVEFGNGKCRHTAGIRDVDINNYNKIFASCGDDGRVLIWDERNRDKGCSAIRQINVSDKPVVGIAFEPRGGNWIVTADEGGKISLYDLRKVDESFRVLYDPNKETKGTGSRTSSNSQWEGSRKSEGFKDVQVSGDGWVGAVSEKGEVYCWDINREFEMTKIKTGVKATSMCLSRM